MNTTCQTLATRSHGSRRSGRWRCSSVRRGAGQAAGSRTIKDADTFFGVELPALTEWTFGAEQAAAIRQPVLSVLGSNTAPLWIDVAEFLRDSVSDVEERTIDGVGHLLHVQRPEPVAEAIADFLRRHPVT